MFASNQVLQASGTFGQLADALGFALKLKGIKEKENLAFQVTEDGRFCIGRIYGAPVKGWTAFFPGWGVESVAGEIADYLAGQPHEAYDQEDGGYIKTGFLMFAIPEYVNRECEMGIANPSFGIVEFRQFPLFYSM